jgi:hypothetical protein
MCQEPLSAPTHMRDSERGASDLRTGFAPVGPFVHLSSHPSIQEMVPDTFISSCRRQISTDVSQYSLDRLLPIFVRLR